MLIKVELVWNSVAIGDYPHVYPEGARARARARPTSGVEEDGGGGPWGRGTRLMPGELKRGTLIIEQKRHPREIHAYIRRCRAYTKDKEEMGHCPFPAKETHVDNSACARLHA
jgi:hypothetical protein